MTRPRRRAPADVRIRTGSRIAEARRAAGLTQRDLAERIGTSAWVVDELERGRSDPTEYVVGIESATDRPAGWLGRAATIVRDGRPLTRGPSRSIDPTARFDRNAVLGTFACILTIRFFTGQLGVLPVGANFVDVLLLPILLAIVAVRPRPGRETLRGASSFAPPAFLVLGLCVASAAVNISRVAPAPSLLFIYGFLGPLVFFWATYQLWPVGEALSLSRVIAAIGLLQFLVIGLFDLPVFVSSRNPDDIAGTFAGNAYQLVFFLLVFAGLVAGLATFEKSRRLSRFAPLIFAATFVVIFLAQYRALIVTAGLTIILVGVLLGAVRGRGFIVGAMIVTAFVAGLGYVAVKYPAFKLSPTLEAVRDDPTLFISARLSPGRDVLSLYSDDPRFIAVGTGPGTYSSRAWRTFAAVGDPSSAEGAAQPYADRLTGGQPYTTDVSDRYVVKRLENLQAVLGSNAVNSPFSSYLALLAEIGLLGFFLMVLIYVSALLGAGKIAIASMRRAAPDDPLPPLALATTVAFFLLVQMAFLENWWEVARVTIPSWIMLAVCMKEYAARSVTESRA